MIILATILIIGVVVINSIQHQKKILIMTILVSLLVLINFGNEFSYYWSESYPKVEQKQFQRLQISEEVYKNSQSKSLIPQQNTLLIYLTKKIKKNSNLIIYFSNLNIIRFKTIFSKIQNQHSIKASHINLQSLCPYKCLQQSLSKYSTSMVYLIVENLFTKQDCNNLNKLYQNYNISLILLSIPSNFTLCPLSRWTQTYQFQANYVQGILDKSPPKLIQLCQKYHTIDYKFYLMTLSNPLIEICSELPTNKATQCIRQYIKSPQQSVPYTKVKHCLKGEFPDGVIILNGKVKIRKQYFYSGKVDKNIFKEFKVQQL